MFVKFSDIPGHQNLFLDYLYEYGNVSRFYKYNFRDKEQYPAIFRNILNSNKFDGTRLSAVFNRQYLGFQKSSATEENILSFGKDNTLAVVTGQQLGILSGPLYTIYKIITAIKLASNLNSKYDNYNFVPVFWLEGDDHDFDEVTWVNFINEVNEIETIKYNETIEEEPNRGSVGNIKITEAINSFFEEYEKKIRPSDFKDDITLKLKSFYAEGKTYKEAFKELIFWLFDKYGLIIFDPQDKEIKEALIPIFRNEIASFRQHTEKVVNVSAVLEELYHVQVKIRPINLFYTFEEGRYLIEPVDNEYRLRGKRKRFSYEEMIHLVETEPEKFSPNVLLRPICQDYLLPTAFYIGGPSEVSYFAQVNSLYQVFNVEPPIIYPRSSATLLEKTIASVIEKFDLNIKDIFGGTDPVKNKIVSSLTEENLDAVFKEANYQIELAFDSLKEKLFDIDKTLSDAGNKSKQSVLNSIQQLKGKAIEAQKKKHEVTLRQIDKASVHLYPNGNLQEREINVFYYLNKYGTELLDKIIEELEINKFEHQVISI